MIIVDLETAPLDSAAAYVPPPDLDSITAAKNLRDPVKIQEDVARRRAEALSGHAEKLSKAALDFNLARIVAIGWSMDGGENVSVQIAPTECAEADLLELFWAEVNNAQGWRDTGMPLVGFRIRTFDAPMLMARSRFLGVRCPKFDLGRYNRNSRIIDLWDELTYGLSDYDVTTVMPRRLKTYAQRYGLTVEDTVDGADIPALVAEGNWEAVTRHVTSDVRLTAQLAQRLGVLAGVAA